MRHGSQYEHSIDVRVIFGDRYASLILYDITESMDVHDKSSKFHEIIYGSPVFKSYWHCI